MEILVESAQAIARFLRDQGYTEERLSQLGLAELPWNSLAGQSTSALARDGDPRLELLIRAFYLGEAVETSQAEKLIPEEILRDLLESGLLARDGERLRPACMLTHFGELIIACDFRRRAETGAAADLVLGVNPTTRLLAQVQHTPSGEQSFGSWHRLWHARAGRGSLRRICCWHRRQPAGLEFCRIQCGFERAEQCLVFVW